MGHIRSPEQDANPATPLRIYGLTILACAITTVVATPLLDYLDPANIVMLFLLTVLLVAVKLGRSAAILASVLSVLCFDLFFVPPRFSLAVSNIQYLVTFFAMLVTSLITTHFTSVLKHKARQAEQRERQTRALYRLARQLAGALSTAQVIEVTRDFIDRELAARCELLTPHEPVGHLHATEPLAGLPWENHLAQTALTSGELVRSNEMRGMGYAPLYFPLTASMRTRGVLAVSFPDHTPDPDENSLSLLQALSSLIAVALERLHYVEVAQSTAVKMQTERLRSSILSALSHDLRTPLTAMVGLADALNLIKPPLPQVALETAQTLREQAERLASLVSNLLDMARLNAGEVTLRREWQPLEEVVGASIKLLGNALSGHPVRTHLPASLPLLSFDAVLVERVLCNLLENAAKYAPSGTPVEIAAAQEDDRVLVSVRDHGPGLPEHTHHDLFDMFVRGQGSHGKPGSGLGLAICRAIVEAHQGEILACNMPDGGACITFSLPVGQPPVIEEEHP